MQEFEIIVKGSYETINRHADQIFVDDEKSINKAIKDKIEQIYNIINLREDEKSNHYYQIYNKLKAQKIPKSKIKRLFMEHILNEVGNNKQLNDYVQILIQNIQSEAKVAFNPVVHYFGGDDVPLHDEKKKVHKARKYNIGDLYLKERIELTLLAHAFRRQLAIHSGASANGNCLAGEQFTQILYDFQEQFYKLNFNENEKSEIQKEELLLNIKLRLIGRLSEEAKANSAANCLLRLTGDESSHLSKNDYDFLLPAIEVIFTNKMFVSIFKRYIDTL